MATMPATEPPPEFTQARSRRQKARAAGLDPNYWYAVEQASRLKRGEVMETMFWGRSIAVFRGRDGVVRALENRCAHRHIKLTEGVVEDCRLTCPYHGWSYDETGLAHIPHDLFDTKDPKFYVPVVPVRERYGLIFIFPGDPEMAKVRDIPTIPELEGASPWPFVYVQFDSPGHHSMLLDNVSDFTHGFLHRKFEPFRGMDLLRLESFEDRVEVEYRSKIAAGFWQNLFINRGPSACDHMIACYDYPYHWSNTDNRIKHFLFTLPVDKDRNRHIFIFYFSPDLLSVPGLGVRVPRFVSQRVFNLSQRLIMKPLLGQDVWVLGHEQAAWERFWQEPAPELNPVVKAFQDLTIKKWSEHLEQQALVRPLKKRKRA